MNVLGTKNLAVTKIEFLFGASSYGVQSRISSDLSLCICNYPCISAVRSVVAERLCFHRRLSFYSQRVFGRHPHPGQTPPGSHPPDRHPLTDTPAPAPEMATAADGTHPTGMHSCFNLQLHLKCIRLLIFPSVFLESFLHFCPLKE